ncbi:sulfotransferase domain-containing protein [Xanthomonas campestris pv. cannae]|nr:sulfotransferase domain-containing protein [Xanthomonas campestris pv. cannae]
MTPDFVFIAGMEKSGTTALASWLVDNGLARFSVPGVKEPHTYLLPGTMQLPPAELPWLDASASYAMSPDAIARLPQHRTKIVLCLRNPLQRAWSAYRMKKIAALGGAAASQLHAEYTHHAGCFSSKTPAGEPSDTSTLNVLRDISLLFFPRASAPHVERHFAAEAQRLRTTTFADRAAYEMRFMLSRRAFPFLSMLEGSFCYNGLRAIADRYCAQDIILVSLNRLHTSEGRAGFLHRLLGRTPTTEPVPFAFSSQDVPLDELPPDYTAPALSTLRDALTYDLQQCMHLIASCGIADDLLDLNALHRHLQ